MPNPSTTQPLAGHWQPALTPASIQEKLVPTCHQVLQLFATGVNELTEPARLAVLRWMQHDGEIEMRFRLLADGRVRVNAFAGETPLFEAGTAPCRETEH